MTHSVLIRYLPDGSFDTSFGGGFGFATVPFFADDVAIDKDQRIVVSGVGGSSSIDIAVARYLGDQVPPPEEPESGGQTGGGGSTQSPPVQPTIRKPKPRHCRKGFQKRRVHGTMRCVRIRANHHKPHRHKSHRR